MFVLTGGSLAKVAAVAAEEALICCNKTDGLIGVAIGLSPPV
jgi:uncharacterized membrane protein